MTLDLFSVETFDNKFTYTERQQYLGRLKHRQQIYEMSTALNERRSAKNVKVISK